jgi:hypothetical protein
MLGMFQILTMCEVDTELIKLIVLKHQMKSKEYRSSIDKRELMTNDGFTVSWKYILIVFKKKKSILEQLVALDWFYDAIFLGVKPWKATHAHINCYP